jgi:hypothetical protein
MIAPHFSPTSSMTLMIDPLIDRSRKLMNSP